VGALARRLYIQALGGLGEGVMRISKNNYQSLRIAVGLVIWVCVIVLFVSVIKLLVSSFSDERSLLAFFFSALIACLALTVGLFLIPAYNRVEKQTLTAKNAPRSAYRVNELLVWTMYPFLIYSITLCALILSDMYSRQSARFIGQLLHISLKSLIIGLCIGYIPLMLYVLTLFITQGKIMRRMARGRHDV
jgi:hypothetical protein